MTLSKTTTCVILLLLATIISMSPLIDALFSVKANRLSLIALLAILFIRNAWEKIKPDTLLLLFLIMLLTTISASYWQENRVILLPIYFIASILVVSALTNDDIKIFVEILTWIMLVVLIGAVLGMFYALFGGVSIFSFPNEDGRINQLYLTTLTNSQYLNFIRPSGIFDEPGALSFVTCFLAALRHAFGFNKRITWALLLLGLVTLSLAHIIYVILHALEEFRRVKKRKSIFVAVMITFFLYSIVNFIPPIQDLYVSLLQARLQIEEGQLTGDNRTVLLLNAASYINLNTFLFGLDSDCAIGVANCTDKGYEQYGENPLTLLVHWGGLVSFPFYLALVYLAMIAVRHRSFVILAVFLLLFQRPNTMSYGYSMLIVLTIYVLAHQRRYKALGKPPLSLRLSSVSSLG